MLLDRAKGLSARIEQYTRLKEMAHKAKQLETRANQFSNASEKIGQTRDVLKKMRVSGITIPFVPKEGLALAEKAGTLRTAVQQDLKVLDDPPFDLKHAFSARLDSIHEAAENEMLEAWKRCVRDQSDPASEDVLNALSALAQFRPAVAKIRECRAKIESLESALPTDPSASIIQLKSIVKEHRAAWSDMTAEGIPSAVIAFLRVCTAEGAPLSDLTDEVQSWLESRNLLNAFRIKIR